MAYLPIRADAAKGSTKKAKFQVYIMHDTPSTTGEWAVHEYHGRF